MRRAQPFSLLWIEIIVGSYFLLFCPLLLFAMLLLFLTLLIQHLRDLGMLSISPIRMAFTYALMVFPFIILFVLPILLDLLHYIAVTLESLLPWKKIFIVQGVGLSLVLYDFFSSGGKFRKVTFSGLVELKLMFIGIRYFNSTIYPEPLFNDSCPK
jgi:hypothetical protein